MSATRPARAVRWPKLCAVCPARIEAHQAVATPSLTGQTNWLCIPCAARKRERRAVPLVANLSAI